MQSDIKLLWVTNKVLPAIQNILTGKNNLVNEGWLDTMFKQLCLEKNISLSIVCFGGTKSCSGDTNAFSWYVIEESRTAELIYNPMQTAIMKKIIDGIHPDIIHVWGSEYPHTLAVVEAAKECNLQEKLVISIQGLISECAKAYFADIDSKVIHKKTLYDFLRKTSIYDQQKSFEKRGEAEILALNQCKHVIGRTRWDYEIVTKINNKIKYHFCNETLREEFYKATWEYDKCKKHSIFISQASYPLKGFHILLDIIPALKKKYPDIQVRICGANPMALNSFKDILKQSSYGKYLRKTILKLHLNDIVSFLGKMNAEQIRNEYLNANVFLCPSSLENSSNSIGEAMLLGMPVVASRVGGIPSILQDRTEGILYQWDDRKELYKAICAVFENTCNIDEMCKNAQKHALCTHNPNVNYSTLLGIYEEIYLDNRKEDN